MKTILLVALLLVACAKPEPPVSPYPQGSPYAPSPGGYTPGGGHAERIPECVVRC